ncbi:MAG: Linear gramicidin synthase subunit [Planctomycetota bacterium]|jgi:thioester reductase-like protein
MYCLLTGATGLLGRYLLQELLVRQTPVAVLVRSQRMATAADRVETILNRSERLLGRSLPRPVLIEGGLDSAGLRINANDRQWLATNCSRVLHSAASLKFVADVETGEPWKSNVDATTGLIADCERLGIREFHAVSTAYVAGQRTGVVPETDLDVGQSFGNVYEESKCEAEKRLRAARHLDAVTIYRPSIIVGDSRTGFSSTYHGFYTPLRVASELLGVLAQSRESGLRFLELMGLRGDERKDLVPVDWVAAAIARLMASPSCFGQTYHLTTTQPVTVATIHDVFEQVLYSQPPAGRRRASAFVRQESASLLDHLEAARRQMEVYRSYWRDDPRFDRTNTERALADLPCPVLDTTTLAMLANEALRDHFGWPAPAVIPARHDIRQHFESFATRWLAADSTKLSASPWKPSASPVRPSASTAEASRTEPFPPSTFWGKASTIGWEITGPGGVSWRFSRGESQPPESSIGLPIPGLSTVIFRMTASVFDRLRAGEWTSGEAIASGRVAVFAGSQIAAEDVSGWLEFFVSSPPSLSAAPT